MCTIYWPFTFPVLGIIPSFLFPLYFFLMRLSKKNSCVQKSEYMWNSKANVCVPPSGTHFFAVKYGFVGTAQQWCDCIYLCSIFSCQDPATCCQDRRMCTWGNGERCEVQEDTNTRSLHLAGGWAHRSLELFKDRRKDKLLFFFFFLLSKELLSPLKKALFNSLPLSIALLNHLYSLE